MPFLAGFDISAIPFKTDRTLRKVPYVTYTLCFINIFIYLATLGRSNYDVYNIVHHYGFIVNDPSILTLFTSAFLHTDLQHLAGNLLILWLVGTVLEVGIGSVVFLLLYLASLVCAITLNGMIGRIFMPDSLGIPLVGASGAISGITGLAAFRYFRVRVLTIPVVSIAGFPIPLPILLWIPLWVYAVLFTVRELLAGFSELSGGDGSMVAHWAHIGGLVVGVVMAMVMNVAREGRREFALEDSTRAAAGQKPRDRSLQELRGLLREHPNDPEILEAMAALLLVQGEHEKSRDLYLKAVRFFLAANLRDRAAVCYLNVLHSFPQTVLQPREQITLAATLESLGHFQEAAQAFTLIIDAYPNREEAQTAIMRTAQLNVRYLNDPVGAEYLLRLFLERYPESHWHNLAQERLRELTGSGKTSKPSA
ncbi:MAG: rhomboid family intramembrane serine protease [Armatimonadota bacterium]